MVRAKHDFDLYRTPKPLAEKLIDYIDLKPGATVFECCADGNEKTGAIASVFDQKGFNVVTGDIRSDSGSEYVFDATDCRRWCEVEDQNEGFDYVITNPPFSLAEEILPLAWKHSAKGVYFLLRLSYAEPCKGRRDWLKAHVDQQVLQMVVNPRPKFRSDVKGSDQVTLAWFGWRHDWSWKMRGVKPPFAYCSDWMN